MFQNRMGAVVGWMFLVMGCAISGCTAIQLTSNYDETIDTQAQQLQQKFDAYFIALQNAADETLKYKNQQTFYEDALSDLNAMDVRASGIYKNQLTLEQLKLARINFAYLVLLHKQCVTQALTAEQIARVEQNGIDLSMDCNVNYGASSDMTDRGEIAINRFLLPPIQSLFNQQFGAVMALELAKKRGDE